MTKKERLEVAINEVGALREFVEDMADSANDVEACTRVIAMLEQIRDAS